MNKKTFETVVGVIISVMLGFSLGAFIVGAFFLPIITTLITNGLTH